MQKESEERPTMTTISSINEHLPSLRYFKNVYRLHEWTGLFPNDIKTLSIVWADYDEETGKCTGIYDYAYGDAKAPRHYHGEGATVCVIAPVEEWMNGLIDRKEVCKKICDLIIEARSKSSESTPPKVTPDYIPLSLYANLHGISPATARQKALRGGWKTAVKIGRDWVIDENEPFSDNRKKKDE